MKAIEINTKTDKQGHLKLNYQLNKKDRKVRVIILIDEQSDDIDEEKEWISNRNNIMPYLFGNMGLN